MQGPAPGVSVIHTALWKDEDVYGRNISFMKSLDKKKSRRKCRVAERFPFAGHCSLHHGRSRNKHNNPFPDHRFPSIDCPNTGVENGVESTEKLWETDYNSQSNDGHELRSSMHPGGRGYVNLPATITVNELNPEKAIFLAEVELFNYFGVTESDRRHLRDYLYGTTMMRSDHDTPSPLAYSEGPNMVLSDRYCCYDGEDDVRKHQNEVWRSLNEWLDYMYPDACRSHR